MNKTIEQSALRQRLLSLLDKEKKFNYFTVEIDDILTSNSQELFYSSILELYIKLNFSEKEARDHWKNILNNIDFIKSHLNREIGLRVAIVDYFINHTDMMRDPIVVEMRLFKENEKLALIDSLTGLFNKRFYDITVKKEYKSGPDDHRKKAGKKDC